MPDPRLDITVIVNGQPTAIRANPNAPLRSIVERALDQTNTTGQPPENWELRYNGAVLDLAAKIATFGFPANAELFLNLKAGIGGSA